MSNKPSDRVTNTDYHVHATEAMIPKAYAGPFRWREQAERVAVEYAKQGWSVRIEAEPSPAKAGAS